MLIQKNKLLFVIGTRPEAIKLAPVILHIRKYSDINIKICSTGQHKEMIAPVFALFGLKPDYDLAVMQSKQSLHQISQKILVGVSDVIEDECPDIVVVHGDTTTSLMAGLAAFYAKKQIFHIEAGLRTGDMQAPWPEEANRKLTAVLSDIHFAPTMGAKNNLLRENIDPSKIFVTGNTVIDALFIILKKLDSDKTYEENIRGKFKFIDFSKKILLVTGHRRENYGKGIENLCTALEQISSLYRDCEIVIPVHLNPVVSEPIHEKLGKISNIHLIEPLDYADFVFFMSKSYLIITDSGGIQEEAPSLGIPVLVTRETTERPEAVEAGTVKLVGTNPKNIVETASELIVNPVAYKLMSGSKNPYGDGEASSRIFNVIQQISRSE